jgi:hypothetical protein
MMSHLEADQPAELDAAIASRCACARCPPAAPRLRRTGCAEPATRRPGGIVGRDSRFGIQHAKVDAAVVEALAALKCYLSHVEQLCRLDQLPKREARRNNPVPQIPRLKVGDDAAHSAEVVGVRVRDGDRVEPPDAARPEVRRDHFLSGIELRPGVLRHASGVHQQGLAFRRDQQQRIALADIDGGNFQDARMPLRLRWKKTIQAAEASSPARPIAAKAARRRDSSSASTNARAAAQQTAVSGVSTRTSEIRMCPMTRTVPVSASTA